MVPVLEPMAAPTSFSARRPHASNLPNFELPPPPSLANAKYPGFPHLNLTQLATPASSLSSVGNLLTPPSNASSDSMSPAGGQPGGHTSYTPTSGGMWPPPPPSSTSVNATSPYSFQSAQSATSPFGQTQQRGGLFSPSLNSVIRAPSSTSPATTDGLPAPPYEMPPYPAASMPMSGGSLPSLLSQSHTPHSHQQHHSMVSSAMMGGQQPVSSAQSPPLAQDAYARQPATPTYFGGGHLHSQPPPPHHHQQQHQHSHSYSYPTATSPQQHVGNGGMKMSPVNGGAPQPPQPLQPQFGRTYTYPLPGPVLSNVNNPSAPLQVVGGLPPGMAPAFNSGHAAHMQMYGHHAAHQGLHLNPQADRPFRCDQCPQSFNRNHDLKRHKRIHLAVKPFPCGHCDKSFSRKDALKRHVLVKGCGKASANSDVKEVDGSSSPSSHSESAHGSPVVHSAA